MWFPILYMLFIFPPPDTVVAMVTQPLKIAISQLAIDLLHFAGYPIAGSGVMIMIGQYGLLIAAACAGLNSLISLSAIGLFYIYVRHNANWRYAVLLMLAIVPVAVLANFIRVIVLILITYHMGDAAAQGFLHNFSGITMFLFSVLGIFGVDALASPLRRHLARVGQG
jgi:exosortase